MNFQQAQQPQPVTFPVVPPKIVSAMHMLSFFQSVRVPYGVEDWKSHTRTLSEVEEQVERSALLCLNNYFLEPGNGLPVVRQESTPETPPPAGVPYPS